MLIHIWVKPGQHTDRLWRSEAGLVAHIRSDAADSAINAYLIRFVAGELRVAKSLVRIIKGPVASHKTLEIKLPEVDLRPQLDRLTSSPQSGLFESE